MKCFFNCFLIVLGTFLCAGYQLTKSQVLSLIAKEEINAMAIAALVGAIFISFGLLNIFITFYIVDKSKK